MIERFIEKWLPKYPGRMIKRVALLTWWKEKCGHLLLNELTASVIADCRDRLLSENTVRGSQRSPATVNRYLSSLGKALTVAVKEWEWLDDTPMRKVSKPRESTGRDRFLSEIEKVNLLRECRASRNHNLYPMVALSLITGARPLPTLAKVLSKRLVSFAKVECNFKKNGGFLLEKLERSKFK